ncbi:MAG: hypothetical protein JWN88_2091, partial [Frankiales bacterium]|nr:hypothetical protein [Frankiales bacterium]
QPTSAEEDQPVLPDSTVDGDLDVVPTGAVQVEPEPVEAGPRRRRRATSRPAGPPA